jgi:Undecaprenyl-phosphate glucose phosphotransferase
VIVFIIAYYIRFTCFPLVSDSIPDLKKLFFNLAILLVLWSIYSRIYKLYTSKIPTKTYAGWKPITLSVLSAVFTYAALGFTLKSLDISRLMLAIYSTFDVLILGSWHQFILVFLSKGWLKGHNNCNLLIIGADSLGKLLAERIESHPEYDFTITGFLDDHKKNVSLNNKSKYKILGTTDIIQNILKKREIDRVMITLPLSSHQKIVNLMDICEFEGVEVNIVPDFFRFANFKAKMMNIDGILIIGSRSNPVDTFQYIYIKRALDFLFGIIALILSAPVLLISGIAIKLTSPGPIFYKQKRVGVNGKEFDFYKLRTMKCTPVEVGDTIWTTKNDERRTKLGIFLRKTCIDELPQFLNVIKGDMSVVGPRPERPYFTKQFQQKVPKYMVRHQVKTGITGWAQVNGYRGDTSIPKRIEHDLYYLENWSLLFDLKIIGLTILQGINSKNAY